MWGCQPDGGELSFNLNSRSHFISMIVPLQVITWGILHYACYINCHNKGPKLFVIKHKDRQYD